MRGWEARLRRRLRRYYSRRDRFGVSNGDLDRLRALPRRTAAHAPLLGKRVELTDGPWYVHSYSEIFREEIYRFEAGRPDPVILDCGANIGLSVAYFKQIFPQARVHAFEADPEICAVLRRNVSALELGDVHVCAAAVWKAAGTLQFEPDGAVGGRVVPGNDPRRHISVPAVRLYDWLAEPVDFLKLDIEGAEETVLLDCEPRLPSVARLFFEYHAEPGKPQQLDQLLRLLARNGFRYHIQDANPVAHPFVAAERNPKYDLQLNVFAFREE